MLRSLGRHKAAPETPSALASTAAINFKLLGAALMTTSAYLIWPSDPFWWGFRLLCLILAFAAAVSFGAAIAAMVRRYRRDTLIATHLAEAREPTSARLVSADEMKRAGMQDD